MRVSDLREIAAAAQVDPTYYSFEGQQHESLCLVPWGQKWQVFMFDRVRHEERTFDTEDEACVYFLKRLFQLAPRGN